MAELMETVVIMRDDGFTPEDRAVPLVPLSQVEGAFGIDLDPGADLAELAPHSREDRDDPDPLWLVRRRARLHGRTRRLRTMGYGGRLRAAGPLLADQYAMARRAGFDEVEVAPEIALRQPEAQWLCPRRIGRRATTNRGLRG